MYGILLRFFFPGRMDRLNATCTVYDSTYVSAQRFAKKSQLGLFFFSTTRGTMHCYVLLDNAARRPRLDPFTDSPPKQYTGEQQDITWLNGAALQSV